MVGTLPRDNLMVGRKRFGMTCQLFDAEQIAPQRRLARAWEQVRIPGLPAFKAQWQSLHVFLLLTAIPAINLAEGIHPVWPLQACPRALRQATIKPNSGAGAQSSLTKIRRRVDANVPDQCALIFGEMIWGVTQPANR